MRILLPKKWRYFLMSQGILDEIPATGVLVSLSACGRRPMRPVVTVTLTCTYSCLAKCYNPCSHSAVRVRRRSPCLPSVAGFQSAEVGQYPLYSVRAETLKMQNLQR